MCWHFYSWLGCCLIDIFTLSILLISSSKQRSMNINTVSPGFEKLLIEQMKKKNISFNIPLILRNRNININKYINKHVKKQYQTS